MVKQAAIKVQDEPKEANLASDLETGAKNASPQVVRRKELVTRIVETSGAKPNLVKSVLDAVLKELGDALSNEEIVHVPPLGRISVNRRKDVKNAEILICKIRRNTKVVVETPETEGAD